MKTLLLIFIFTVFAQLTYSQWVATGKVDEDWDDEYIYRKSSIFFTNPNTGWLSSPTLRDTIFKTTNSGVNWTGYTTVDTTRVSSAFFIDQNTGWAVGKKGKIVKTTTGGISWFMQSSGVQSWLNDVSFINSQTGIIVGSVDSSSVILKTTNGGTNWQKILTSSTSKLFTIKMLSSTTAYAVGDSGSILFTSNGGTNWVNQISNVGSTLRDIVMKTTNNGCIAGLNGVILTTTNGGANWINRTFNNINFYSADFGSIDTGYIGGHYGRIYKTTNAGLNWHQQYTPVDTLHRINDIFCINNQIAWAHVYRDKLIYTSNGGLTSISNISAETPSQYVLSQNYPNPFNPNTKIRFTIPKQEFVKLTIFDVTGKTMGILVNENLKTGIYEVDWDASHRASGIYLYKLETENFSSIKKMILIK